ncbi:MAG: M48 family metalloprotease, partial [Actinobacteria bacterium]|nr:M48 family metalloprotease [Actinomycetota bacterium]
MNRFNGSFLSMFFLSLLVFGVLIAVLAKPLSLFIKETFYFCQKIVSGDIYSSLHPFSNTLILSAVIAFSLGILSFLVQFYKTQKLVQKMSKNFVDTPAKLKNIVISLSLGEKVDVVNDKSLFSFCAGIFFPRIIITTSLVENLSEKELEAVLLHEKAHLKARDPLKILLGKTISTIFFFLPIFKELYKNMNATNEILADRFAMQHQKDNSYLKRALRKILIAPQVMPAILPSISHPDYLEIRIHRLVNPAVTRNFGVSLRNLLLSALFIILSLVFIQTPARAFKI